MIIDFHTHIFPERIAEKTIKLLSEKGNMHPYANGTVDGLVSEMEKAGVDVAVTLPVLTNPQSFESVNRFAKEINEAFCDKERRLISFAGIHPRCEDIEGKMAFIKKAGFLGVKIHPDYQDAYITDDGYVRIMECAKEYDLTVVTHSGVDAAYRDRPAKCPPTLALHLIKKVPHRKLVLAHCGANEMFDEVIERLCDADVYFDTAAVLRYISDEHFKKILEAHGADRMLFATDSPWSTIAGDVDRIKSFSLSKETEEKLFCENARLLLGI